MRPITLGVCAALALAPLPAAAATAKHTAAALAGVTGVTGDARCLMTMVALSGAKDQNTARMAQLGVVYFAGRIKAQDPTYDFPARLKALAASLNGQNLEPDAQRCGPMVVQAIRDLQETFGPAKGAPGAAPSAPPPAAPATPPPAH